MKKLLLLVLLSIMVYLSVADEFLNNGRELDRFGDPPGHEDNLIEVDVTDPRFNACKCLSPCKPREICIQVCVWRCPPSFVFPDGI